MKKQIGSQKYHRSDIIGKIRIFLPTRKRSNYLASINNKGFVLCILGLSLKEFYFVNFNNKIMY